MTIKRVTIQLIGDDSQLKRVFDEIERRKKEIAKDVTVRIKADAGKAIDEIVLLRFQLHALKDQLDELKVKGGLGKLGSLFGNGPGGGGSNNNSNRSPILKFFGRVNSSINALISKIPVVGTALSQLSPAAIPAIAAAFILLAGAIGSILGPLTAAALGLGALAALAIPDLKIIKAGVTAVDSATTKLGRNKALKAIPEAFRPAVKNILDIKAAFDKMSKSLEPAIGHILGDATKIAKNLLPILKPFAERAASAIDGLLKQFDKVTQSPGFKSFFNTMKEFTGPAITTIGQGLGQVFGAIGDELKQLMTGKSLVVLKTVFTILAGTIRGVGQALKWSINFIFAFGNAFFAVAKEAVSEAKTVGDAFLSMTSGVLHAMSHIPGLGFLKGWGDAVDRFKTRFDGDMQTAMDKLDSWKTALANAPKIVTLDAHISDLESKLATAKGKLNDKDLTRTRRAQITANISGLLQQIAAARIALYALQSLSVTIPIGGGAFIHRASGGPGGGLTEVGERGPELMYTPRNSYIFNHADSRQLLNSLSRLGGGGKGRGHHRHHMQPPHQVRTITRHFRDEEMNTHGGVQRFHMDTERTQVPVHVHINFNGIVTNADATAKAVRQMLLNYKRNHGGRDLGLA